MVSTGGPIALMEHANVDVFGQPCVHAVTYLKEEIADARSRSLKVRATNQPDGAGCHTSAQVACCMAISESMERWAVYYCRVRLGSGLGGIVAHGRFSEAPFSSHTVIILWSVTDHGQAYAFGAGDNVPHVSGRAFVELERTQSLLKNLSSVSQSLAAGEFGDVFERRIHYFSTEAGTALFMARLRQRVNPTAPRSELLFDRAVAGPWDAYASVWRTVIEAPNREYLSAREDYFFW